MSSILSGFDSSHLLEDSHLLHFEDSYELGDVVPEEHAEKVIDPKNKNIRKGDFVLVRQNSSKGFIYAIFEGDIPVGDIFYDVGNGNLISTELESVYKIKDYRSFNKELKDHSDFFKIAKEKTHNRVKWSKHKDIRIISDARSKKIFDKQLNLKNSTYKYLLKKHAFSANPVKFIKIQIVDEIVKNHVFNDFLALKALKIRAYHDGQLLSGFDKALCNLETARRSYEVEKNPEAYDQYQTAATILKLFMHEVSRRGLEQSRG